MDVASPSGLSHTLDHREPRRGHHDFRKRRDMRQNIHGSERSNLDNPTRCGSVVAFVERETTDCHYRGGDHCADGPVANPCV